MAISPNWEVLVVGRGIVGLAVGCSSAAIPVYIAECAPRQVRLHRSLISIVQIYIYI